MFILIKLVQYQIVKWFLQKISNSNLTKINIVFTQIETHRHVKCEIYKISRVIGKVG